MPIQILLLLLIFPWVLGAQPTPGIGKGILKVDPGTLPLIFLYTDTTQKNPDKKIQVIKTAEGEIVIKDREEIEKWFKPEQLFLEYDIFMMRVEAVSGRWFQVYVDNEKAITMWTKVDTSFRFITWQKFLAKEISAIDKHPSFDLDIKVLPADKANTIKKIEASDCFEVLEIKGDWMHIKTNLKADCNDSKKIIRSGWIKWKQNGKLVINYSLMA